MATLKKKGKKINEKYTDDRCGDVICRTFYNIVGGQKLDDTNLTWNEL